MKRRCALISRGRRRMQGRWPLACGVLALGALSCEAPQGVRSASEHSSVQATHAGSEAAAAAEAPHNDEVLRIDRDMLRDLRVTTQAAESRPAGDAVTVLGELRPNEDAYAEVGTAVEARVVRVSGAPGDRVTNGQALATLSSPDVGQARAALITARARLALARQSEARLTALAREQIVPEREAQAASAELTQATALEQAAQTALSSLGAASGSGSEFELTTPIAGTIIERHALRGRMVDAEQPLFVVADLSRLWLVVHAFERDALRMRSGSTARVSFPALPGQVMTGTLTRVGSRVDPTSRTVDVRIEVENPGGVLRPGMSASALVPLGDAAEQVVAVPLQALQRTLQGWSVFIPQNAEGAFEVRPVGRGRDLGSEVEVLSGLRVGERVVVDGAFLLKAEADKGRSTGEPEHHH